VVSSRSGGIPEAVEDGKTGLLVEEGDCQRLAEAILNLLQNEDLWQRFSAAGRKRVLEKFNLGHQTQRLESLFGNILSSSTSAFEYDEVGHGASTAPVDRLANVSMHRGAANFRSDLHVNVKER
jgi:glycosyl transferase family 1